MKFAARVRISEHKDGAVILDIRTGRMFAANAVGARIVKLLQEGVDPAELVELITHQFEAPLDRVRTDVSNFVARMRSHGLFDE